MNNYRRPKSQEWRDLELAYSFVDKVPAVLLAAVAFNEKRRNIGLKTKTSLFLVLLLSFLGDFTSMLFPPGISFPPLPFSFLFYPVIPPLLPFLFYYLVLLAIWDRLTRQFPIHLLFL